MDRIDVKVKKRRFSGMEARYISLLFWCVHIVSENVFRRNSTSCK